LWCLRKPHISTIHSFNYRVLLAGKAVYLRGESGNFENPLVVGHYNFNLLSQAWELQIVPGSVQGQIPTVMKLIVILVTIIIGLLSAAFTWYRIKAGAELELAYKRIEDSEKKFRAIFDQSPAALLRFNQDSVFTDWNRAAAAMFNFEFPPAQKRNLFKLEGLEPLRPVITSVLAGVPDNYEGFIEVNGRQIEVETKVQQLTSGDSSGGSLQGQSYGGGISVRGGCYSCGVF